MIVDAVPVPAYGVAVSIDAPSPAVPPLRIAIVGAGQIGSAFAFQLATIGGHDATIFAHQVEAMMPASGVAAMRWSMSRIRSFRTLVATLVRAADRAGRRDLVLAIEAMRPAQPVSSTTPIAG